jgi:purine-binding chemotaxis protein CheW
MLSSTSPAARKSAAKSGVRRTTQNAVLVFHVGNQAYGLPLHQLRELTPLAELSRPPGLPRLLAGFLNLGGTAVPVLRLDRLFGLPDVSLGLYTPLLVLRSENPPLALLAERVSRIVNLPAEAVLPVPAGESFNDCADGVATLDDHVLVLLSAERLLLEKEQQCLAELQDAEQARLRELEGIRP